MKNYKVIETDGKNAEDIQKILDTCTDGFPEMQISHILGTKIIMSYESFLTPKGRAELRANKSKELMKRSQEGIKELSHRSITAPSSFGPTTY